VPVDFCGLGTCFILDLLAGVRFVWGEGSLPGKKWGLDGVFCGGGICLGRLKRFIKLGGEMISLPAIESALQVKYPATEDGSVIAIEATPSDDHPEVVLFSTIDIAREDANKVIHEAGLSGLHNIRKIVSIEEIPVLGTGKTNYRELKSMLK